jgi:GNAT superfamily N-acetyltransferase
MSFTIREAAAEDVVPLSGILLEAARWLESRGQPLWRDDELQPDRLATEIAQGLYFIGANSDGTLVATIRFQHDDTLFWPDAATGDAAYIHRLAVRRSAAGGVASSAMMRWAVDRTRSIGRPFLRLDCEASRARLRLVYERFGFRHHSDRKVGPYFVARYQYPVPPTL